MNHFVRNIKSKFLSDPCPPVTEVKADKWGVSESHNLAIGWLLTGKQMCAFPGDVCLRFANTMDAMFSLLTIGVNPCS